MKTKADEDRMEKFLKLANRFDDAFEGSFQVLGFDPSFLITDTIKRSLTFTIPLLFMETLLDKIETPQKGD